MVTAGVEWKSHPAHGGSLKGWYWRCYMPSLICKRGKSRWRASITVQGVTKQKLYPDDSRKSEKEAIIWETEQRKEILEDLKTIHLDYLTIHEWATEYLAYSENHFVQKVFKEKHSVFKRMIKRVGSDYLVKDISVETAFTYLSNQFKERSGYAVNKDRKNLGAAWNWGTRYLKEFPKNLQNPFIAVDKFPEKRKPRYVPSEADFFKVLDKAKGQDRVMLLAFLHLGARRNEIFQIKMSDLDFANARVRLWTRKRKGGNLEFDWLPMTSELKSELLDWRKKRLLQSTIDDDHLFVCLYQTAFCDPYYGKPFTGRQHFMKRLCKDAGVRPFGFHAIRHLTATILYHKGYSLSLIQQVLRHQSPGTTERYLRSIGIEKVRECLEGAFVGKPAEVIPFSKKKTSNE